MKHIKDLIFSLPKPLSIESYSRILQGREP